MLVPPAQSASLHFTFLSLIDIYTLSLHDALPISAFYCKQFGISKAGMLHRLKRAVLSWLNTRGPLQARDGAGMERCPRCMLDPVIELAEKRVAECKAAIKLKNLGAYNPWSRQKIR